MGNVRCFRYLVFGSYFFVFFGYFREVGLFLGVIGIGVLGVVVGVVVERVIVFYFFFFKKIRGSVRGFGLEF